jgi:hypothetical protein
VDERQRARQEKQWALSDQLRDRIQQRGFTVQDTPQGMKVFKSCQVMKKQQQGSRLNERLLADPRALKRAGIQGKE